MNPLSTTDTTVTYIGDGVTTDFPFDFPYLDPAHVFVFVNDVPTAATLFAQQVERIVAPGNGVIVAVERHTPSTPIISFADGTVILSNDLTIAEAQARFIAEEARDLAKRGLRFNDALQAYDAKGFKISNVADPVLDTDALNKRSLDTAIAAVVGTNPLADLLARAAAYAAQVHADRLDIDAKEIHMDADVVTATALAASVAAGPDGATISQRITAYLGSDDWIQGGSGGGTPVAGAHAYWRMWITAGQSAGSGWANFIELEFRQTAGVSVTVSGGSAVYGQRYNTDLYWLGFDGRAFDGVKTGDNRAGVNCLADNQGQYWGYHYATPVKVAEVAIYASQTHYSETVTNFHIDYSDDGVSWMTAFTSDTQLNWNSNECRLYAMPIVNIGPVQTFIASGTWIKPVKGKVAYMQVWGGGAGNNGGGGGYNELYAPLISLPNTLSVGVAASVASGVAGGTTSITGYIYATGGQPNGGIGGTPAGIPLGDNLYNGGANGQSAVYGGAGGNGGTSQHGGASAAAPGGGGNAGGPGARGEVRITVW